MMMRMMKAETEQTDGWSTDRVSVQMSKWNGSVGPFNVYGYGLIRCRTRDSQYYSDFII